jgi:hypothetical protein
MKTQSKEKLALGVATDKAAYILEPLVDRAMAEGLEAPQLLDAAAASVRRVLRACLCDADVKLSVAGLDAEARRIAKKLIDRLTVKDPATVPRANQRRGLPAAVAAALASA